MTVLPVTRPSSRDLALLAGITLVAAGFNLGKAVHIDDTATLEIARWIAGHPSSPMTGLVNWVDTAEPIHRINWPHLLQYLVAPAFSLVPGHVEPVAHAVWALLCAGTIFAFYLLASALAVSGPLVWTAAFALGPGFLPSQNLMMDVPLAGLWIGAIIPLVRPPAEQTIGALFVSAWLASAACLTKYTSLALLPLLALALSRHGDRRRLLVLLVPGAVLAAWSLFNYLDYGAIHIFDRPMASAARPGTLRTIAVVASRATLWLVALGAILPGAFVFGPILGRERAGRRWLIGVATVALGTIAIGRLALGTEPLIQSILRGLFLANGCLVIGLVARAFLDQRAILSARLLLGWAFAAAVFIIFLSPFIAIRHVLIILPALMLIVARGSDAGRLSPPAKAVALGITFLAGGWLGASDARLAEIYRSQAPALAARFCAANTRCVAVGHWGWQWCAAEAGLEIYDRERTALRTGDRVIVPELVAKQTLRVEDTPRLQLLEEISIPASPLTWLRTMATERSGPQGDRSGGYYYFWTSVPWTFTTRPLERFRVYEVAASPAGVN